MEKNVEYVVAKISIGMMDVLVMKQSNAENAGKSTQMRTRYNGGRKMEKPKTELSALKIEQLNKQPILETSLQISEDKKWVVYKTVITDIKPISYMQKVMGSK